MRSVRYKGPDGTAYEEREGHKINRLKHSAKKREELRTAKAALEDPERLREIEKLREKIRELEAAWPAGQAGKSAPEKVRGGE